VGRPLDLESLHCFVVAAEHGNFRSAARVVALSPAAFSDRIRRLEDELGAELFDRTTRRVMLTAAGERLQLRARACLAEAERCRGAVLDGEAPPFDLVLGTRFELGLSWLTPLLAELERARPERRIHLYFGDTADMLRQLRHDAIDCIVTSARIAAAGLSYARLHEERYVFCGAERLLAERPLSRREHCAGHTLLELNGDLPLFRYFLDARPGDEQWSFADVRHLGTIGAVRARALEGAGVAVLPLYFVNDDLKRRRLTRILPGVKMPVDWFRLVWREGHPRHGDLYELAGELAKAPLR
jgi:LysR family transcriptional regulator, glycine cleavage system transcriptional activator